MSTTNDEVDNDILPTISVKWSAERQGVEVSFDPAHFRSWEFVIALLEMAKLQAENNRRMAMMQQAQRIVQGNEVARKLHLLPPRNG